MLFLLLDGADLIVLTFTLSFDGLKYREMKGHVAFGDRLKIIYSPLECLSPASLAGLLGSLLSDI